MNYLQLNWQFDYEELLNYYNTLCSNFSHLKWTDRMVSTVNGSEKHNINGVYGWGIQSNLINLDVPCPPYNISKSKTEEYRDTQLVFGFIEKIKQKYPDARQIGISCHPPGTVINQHIDTTKYLKIHIPIYTNENAYFVFEDKKVNLKVGRAYLINTTVPHGTSNEGDSDRVHLLFKVLAKDYYNDLFIQN